MSPKFCQNKKPIYRLQKFNKLLKKLNNQNNKYKKPLNNNYRVQKVRRSLGNLRKVQFFLTINHYNKKKSLNKKKIFKSLLTKMLI